MIEHIILSPWNGSDRVAKILISIVWALIGKKWQVVQSENGHVKVNNGNN